MRISERVRQLKPSSTVAVMNLAKELKAQGRDVLSFAAGEPDFDTPEPAKEAAIRALREGQTKYMPTFGDMGTREAIAKKLREENGIEGLGGEHVAISAGAKHSLYVTMQVLLERERGDEVLLPVPAWVSYRPLAEYAGGTVKTIETTAAERFKLTPARLREAIGPKARLLVLNTPSNPCGVMYSEEEIRGLCAVVHETRDVAPDLVILTDEIYEKIAYGGVKHFSPGAVEEVAERTITVNGVSKAYAMTGWRVGYLAMPGEEGKEFIGAMSRLQGQMTTNITSFCYPAIRAAIELCGDDAERMRQAFAQRAKLIYEMMSELPGVECVQPTGAFYVFPDVSGLFGKTSAGGRVIDGAIGLAEAMLEEVGVAAVPGDDFEGCGPRHMRFSFACSQGQIEDGMKRVKRFVEGLG